MELPISQGGRRYGVLPPKFKATDYGRPHFFLSTPPPPFDYHLFEKYARVVKDQGAEGSCTGNGGATHQEFLEIAYAGHDVVLSPKGIYYLERQEEGTLAEGDCGAQIQTCAAVLCKYGATPLADQPYVAGDFSTAPTPEQLTEALQYKSGAYHRISTVLDIKNCINSGYTFIIGMAVYDSFENDVKSDGLMPMPDTGKESLLGGHCLSSGWAYDDRVKCPNANSPGAVLTQNSWSASWGLEGRVWIPYEYFADFNFVWDMRITHKGKPW